MSDCIYQMMGFDHCSKTPNLLECRRCATRAGIVRASTPTPETHVYRGPAPPVTPLMDHIAKLERDALDSAGVLGTVILGAPSTSASRGFLGPCDCGRPIYGTARDRGRRCDVCRAPKPPTLREWLGDRVSDLGRWAAVLREQPVPAGDVSAWQWEMFGSEWHLEYTTSTWRARLSRNSVRDAVTGDCDPWELDADSLQMALFTRHPDVPQEPQPAAFPWDPYPEVV